MKFCNLLYHVVTEMDWSDDRDCATAAVLGHPASIRFDRLLECHDPRETRDILLEIINELTNA